MRFIICEDYEGMSKAAADILAAEVLLKPNCILGLATGSTPIGMYQEIAEKKLDLSHVTTFNLDEYYPIKSSNEESYHYFMQENFFSKVNVKKENIHMLDGEAEDPQQECDDYERLINKHGRIDLQVLGIGHNGHIGFNEPNSFFRAQTHISNLTQRTIEANSRFFERIEDMPTKSLTMGVGSIMNSKTIVLLASGKEKAAVIKELQKNKVDPQIPATILTVHRDVIVIVDKEAASLL